MRFTAYVTLMICMAMTFYWLGYQSVGGALITQYNSQCTTTTPGGTCTPGPMNIGDILMHIAQASMQNQSLAQLLLITLVAGTLAAVLGGFGSMYIIPMIILAAVLNWFVFPLGFIVETGVFPDYIAVPLVVLFNGLMILTVVTFVRGGG